MIDRQALRDLGWSDELITVAELATAELRATIPTVALGMVVPELVSAYVDTNTIPSASLGTPPRVAHEGAGDPRRARR